MRIHCLGGFREVGRNAVLIDASEKIMLDYGLKVEEGQAPIFPKQLDSIILAHAHLDHCGMLPSLYRKFKVPLFSTIASFDQSHLLLKDSIKIAKIKRFQEHYNEKDVARMKRFEQNIT